MLHLLLVAHGSRREQSNQEIQTLAARLRNKSGRFADVDCAFLEIAEPSIPEGLRRQIGKGATHIIVMPYFLSAGRHVSDDIPAEIAKISAEFPAVNICMAAYLGASEQISAIVMQQANAALHSYKP